MNNFGLLLKVEISRTLASLFGGKKGTRTGILYVGILIGLLVAAASAFYSFIILDAFKKMELNVGPAISFFVGAVATITFISTMGQARGIYIGDDYDMLSALPLRKRDIVGAKVMMLYLSELLFSLLIMIPHAIMLMVFAKEMTLGLTAVLLAFTLPIFPILIAVLLSLLTTIATARFKYANFVIIAFYTVFLIGFSLLGVLTRGGAEQTASMFTSVGNILKWINPTYMLVELSFTQWWYLLIFLGVNLILLTGTILFLTLLFDKLHSLVASAGLKKNSGPVRFKNEKESKALLGLEFRRLMSSKVYFSNAAIGAIMSIVGSVIYFFSLHNSMQNVEPEALFYMKLLFIPIFVVVFVLVAGISSPAVSAISIEGKNFWIIKSLPIDYRKYMWVKLSFTLILFVPASLIASTIAIIFEHDSALDIVFAYLIPVLFVIASAFFGLTVNINRPKLKWSNETEVVKNSAAVVMVMLIDLGLAIVLGGAMIGLTLVLNNPLVPYLILTGTLLITILIFWIYLHKNFEKKIEAIEDF